MTNRKIIFVVLMSVLFFECSFCMKKSSQNNYSAASENITTPVKTKSAQQKKYPIELTEENILLLRYALQKTKSEIIAANLSKEEQLLQSTEAFFSIVPNIMIYIYSNILVKKYLSDYLPEGVFLSAVAMFASQALSNNINKFANSLYNISIRKLLRPVFKKINNYIY